MNNNLLHTTRILEVDAVAIGYKSKKQMLTIAKGISFSLDEGELTAVVGANGIGKSTLLRTLCGIQPKLGGAIFLNGKILEKHKPIELASELSLVLTEQIPTKNLTVAEVVALGRQPYTNWLGTLTETDVNKVNEAINLVSLEELKQKKCYELSDGQFQKVMIARALAQDTSLIVLDEPTTHLDIYHKAYILKLLKRVAHETKKTILFSTHEIDLAIQLCNKILVMGAENHFFDDPCKLIDQGAFKQLFPSDLIDFDAKTGHFNIHR